LSLYVLDKNAVIMPIDVRTYNRQSWNQRVEEGDRWTVPVSSEQIAAARNGEWEIVLTAHKPVPRKWFPELSGCRVLGLASAGGQQGPILAAAGANVTVFDNSPKQLKQDRFVAERDGLDIRTIEGDMADLSILDNESFDLVFHPVSNVFVPNVRPVWKEAFRVLSHGGLLLAGFTNPDIYLFDQDLSEEGIYQVKYPLPYSDVSSISQERRQKFIDRGWSMEFSHTLTDQIGGQLEAGFLLSDFYEDFDELEQISNYMPSFIATRAIKL
jgi:SAM-dependent methyltransferase